MQTLQPPLSIGTRAGWNRAWGDAVALARLAGAPARTKEPPVTDPRRGDRAVRIPAGDGSTTAAGLDETGVRTLLDAWRRCGAEEVAAPAEGAAAYREATGWDWFHENLVHSATTAAITAGVGRRLLFHGACLADPGTGSAVALVAASGTGKTTATRRLGPHYAYLTDETVIVAPDTLEVTPFPKPLSLLGPSGVRPKTQVSPDELGLGDAVPARLARLAVLDRVRDVDGPVTARAETMGLGDALIAVVPQTSSLARLPRGLRELCRVIDRLGGVQRLVYAEADGLRPVVDELLAAAPEPLEPAWEPLTPAELAASRETGDAAAGAARREAVDDGIVTDDGRLILLAGPQLAALEGLGPVVWLMLEEPLTNAQIVERLAAEGPVPDDAADRVADAVAALAESGLVRI